MKRGIISYLIEIIFIIGLLLFAYYIINNSDYKKINKAFIENNNIAISIKENNNYYLKPMSDSYAQDNALCSVINIRNYNDNNINYKLFMRIKKDKKINFQNLKIRVDNDIFRLNTKYDYEDDEYQYFDLVHKNVDVNNDVNFAMWLDENVNDVNNYNFSYNFYVERI